MSETLRRVEELVRSGDYRVSSHAHTEHEDQAIDFSMLVEGVVEAEVWRATRSTRRVHVCWCFSGMIAGRSMWYGASRKVRRGRRWW